MSVAKENTTSFEIRRHATAILKQVNKFCQHTQNVFQSSTFQHSSPGKRRMAKAPAEFAAAGDSSKTALTTAIRQCRPQAHLLSDKSVCLLTVLFSVWVKKLCSSTHKYLSLCILPQVTRPGRLFGNGSQTTVRWWSVQPSGPSRRNMNC